VQEIESGSPLSTRDEVVPVRNQIVEWTTGSRTIEQFTGVTEWYAAIHAAATLLTQRGFGEMRVKLVPIMNALRRIS